MKFESDVELANTPYTYGQHDAKQVDRHPALYTEQLKVIDTLIKFLGERHKNLTDRHMPSLELANCIKIEKSPLSAYRVGEYVDPDQLPFNIAVFLQLEDEGKSKYRLSPRAVSQLNDKLDLPKAYINKLLGDQQQNDANFSLVQQIYKHELERIPCSELLVRFADIKDEKKSASGEKGIVRAILPGDFNRLDNIYILSAVQAALNSAEYLCSYDLSLQCDGDNLRLEMKNSEHKRALESVNDEVLAGFSLRNSETAPNSLYLEMLLVRLVCTNGMTSKNREKIKLSTRVKGSLLTSFWNELPPVELPELMQKQIDFAVQEALYEVSSQETINSELVALDEELNLLANQPIELDDPRALRALVGEVLKLGGLRLLRGVSVDDVIKAVEEERQTLEGNASDSALVLFHAITRVARNFGSAKAQREEQRRRGRGRRSPAMSIVEQWDLGDQIRERARIVSNRSFDWEKVHRKARRATRKIEVPHI